MKMKYTEIFNPAKGSVRTPEMEKIVKFGANVTKMAINKIIGNKGMNSFLATKYSVPTEAEKSYIQMNDVLVNDMLQYASKMSGVNLEGLGINIKTKEGLLAAFTYESVQRAFFTIQQSILNTINSDTEVEDALMFANIMPVGYGDSLSVDIHDKSLYKIQDGAYGNNISVAQNKLASTINITPRKKHAVIDFNLAQMGILGYDYGKEMAKLALSFRAKLYKDIVDVIFTVANVSSTPFYKGSFAKTTFLDVAERLSAVNSASVAAYGTKLAWGSISDTITGGFMVQDELVKAGYIDNIFGVQSVLVNQAIDSNVSTYDFRVPNDRILMLSAVGDKPVKVVRESLPITVMVDSGVGKPLDIARYGLQDSWTAQLCSQAHYGIVVI